MNSQLNKAFENLHSSFPDYQIYLFGSQARKDNNFESDVDICAVVPDLKKDPFDIAYELRVELKKYIKLPMDIVVVSAENFTSRKLQPGTLEHTIASEGIAV
jgi:predicted nucleotidyltransferase